MHLGGLPACWLDCGTWCQNVRCTFSSGVRVKSRVRRGEMVAELRAARWVGWERGGETDGRTAACNEMQLRSAVCSLWGTRRDRYDASSKRISNHESPQPSLLSPLLMCVSPPLCLFSPLPSYLPPCLWLRQCRAVNWKIHWLFLTKIEGVMEEKIDGERN